MPQWLKKLKYVLWRIKRRGIIAAARFGPLKDVLVYVGVSHGQGLDGLFYRYKHCYCFEASPSTAEALKAKYARYPWVHIIHAAATVDNVDSVPFNITDHAASSSLFPLTDEWNRTRDDEGLARINLKQVVHVPGIRLPDWLADHGVEAITDYISDIEGMDLAVLKTLEPFIAEKRIETITCEVSIRPETNRHVGCPDNSKAGFTDLLDSQYDLVAEGFTPLEDGTFVDLPDDTWIYDCRWRRR